VRTIIDLLHVGFVLVVPLALVVSDGEHLGKRRGACDDSPCDQLVRGDNYRRTQAGEPRTRQAGVLLEHVLGLGAEQEEDVDDAGLAHPVGLTRLWNTNESHSTPATCMYTKEREREELYVVAMDDIDVGLGGIEPEDASGHAAGGEGQHERNGTVQSHRVVQLHEEQVARQVNRQSRAWGTRAWKLN
jgi:hypothetical protein